MAKENFPLIFERSQEGRTSYNLPALDVPEVSLEEGLDDVYVRKVDAELPEVDELELMRHYTGLSNRNYGILSGFYTLRSEEHTSELQSRFDLVCRLLLEQR